MPFTLPGLASPCEERVNGLLDLIAALAIDGPALHFRVQFVHCLECTGDKELYRIGPRENPCCSFVCRAGLNRPPSARACSLVLSPARGLDPSLRMCGHWLFTSPFTILMAESDCYCILLC